MKTKEQVAAEIAKKKSVIIKHMNTITEVSKKTPGELTESDYDTVIFCAKIHAQIKMLKWVLE